MADVTPLTPPTGLIPLLKRGVACSQLEAMECASYNYKERE